MRRSFEASAAADYYGKSCDDHLANAAALQMHAVLIGKGCRHQRSFHVEMFSK
jgi:hypothetical protein